MPRVVVNISQHRPPPLGDADNIVECIHNVICLYTGCRAVRLVPYEFVAVSHDSCGFESGAWQSFFVFNFKNNHGFVEVLCALRLVTPPVENN